MIAIYALQISMRWRAREGAHCSFLTGWKFTVFLDVKELLSTISPETATAKFPRAALGTRASSVFKREVINHVIRTKNL